MTTVKVKSFPVIESPAKVKLYQDDMVHHPALNSPTTSDLSLTDTGLDVRLRTS